MPEETPEYRQVSRVSVPWQLTDLSRSSRLGRLLDLSPLGARIECPDPLQEGRVCVLDLRPVLGQGRLAGRVVWTRPHTPARTFEGDTRVHYQSGLAFVHITPEQRVVLAVALELLKMRDYPAGT